MVVARLSDGRILEVNEAFCFLVSRGTGELLHASIFDLGLFEGLGVARAHELLETRGVIEGFDATIVPPTGEKRIVRLWAESLEAEDPLVIVRASDVDGRATAGTRYHELRETEIRYRALVESISAITYTQVEDPSSPTGFRDIYISPQTAAILGLTPDELHSDPTLWLTATHPDDRQRVLDEELNAGRSGTPFRSEYRMIARDGRVVWFRDEAVLVEDPVSGVSFWPGVMRDIRAEQELLDQRAATAA